MGDGERWDVSVLDVLGRRRHVEVRVSAGRVLMVPPAATGIVIPRMSIEPLCDALRAADAIVERAGQAGGRPLVARGWRTSLVVEGFDLSGRRVPILVGLLETASGGVQLAVRASEDGDPTILPLQAGSWLITNLRKLLVERVRLAGEGL